MKARRFTSLLVICGTLALVAACIATSSSNADDAATAISQGNLPTGYRDWTLISVARVGAPINDLRAKLGNDAAIATYRDGKRWFPDGAIIARLAWHAVTSEENNKAFRAPAEKQLGNAGADRLLAESFVAGPATNVQFMVKDSKKFASTGGWQFIEFDNGKPAPQAVQNTCFSCHQPAAESDFVFTRYAQ